MRGFYVIVVRGIDSDGCGNVLVGKALISYIAPCLEDRKPEAAGYIQRGHAQTRGEIDCGSVEEAEVASALGVRIGELRLNPEDRGYSPESVRHGGSVAAESSPVHPWWQPRTAQAETKSLNPVQYRTQALSVG
tara:strand:- start:115 stop:516 length:402 start_codon:yes stop_codon:yes gene_type:complete